MASVAEEEKSARIMRAMAEVTRVCQRTRLTTDETIFMLAQLVGAAIGTHPVVAAHEGYLEVAQQAMRNQYAGFVAKRMS